MKKKTLGRIAVFAFALCMVSTCLLSGTLAKYTTEATGTGTVVVAKFVDITSIAGSGSEATYDFNLHDTKWDNTAVNDGKIAPGDKGSFDIIIGTSDVDYTYDLTLSSVANNIPITFKKADNSDWVNINDGEGVRTGETITINWEWVPDSENTADNNAKLHATDVNEFTVSLTAEQVVGTPTAPVEP